jgi:hypothetical protein
MYRILPLKRKIQQQIIDLKPSEQKKLKNEAFPALETNPHWAPGNKIGRFKGDLRHLGWHYRLAYSPRIHYQINEMDQKIEITYIGSHPEY